MIDERVASLEARLADAGEEEARESIARELRYWHTRQVTALDAPPPPSDEVAFGSRVLVRIAGRERMIEIVGHDEADAATGRIAFSAPLARALMGATEGERIAFGEGVDILKICEPRP
ncbi:GreA/GreB family elongation factor [Sphingomonas tabacisoli]|uniref:GreA/GreB family elongation factor n=1 Tax=Sphingomonas tabacisoli TaxID=2249466 RepID=A0ABW4HZU0_9SPHN